MSGRAATLDDILSWSRTLSPKDRIHLIQRLAADLEADVPSSATEGRSLRGLWSDLGPGPSETVLERARSEIWAPFPRADLVGEVS